MTASAQLDQQVQEEQERHDLLEKLTAQGVTVDPDMSLAGLQELYATFGPGAQTANAQIERQRENVEADEPGRKLETAPDEPETVGNDPEDPGTPKPDPEGKRLFNDSDYEREDLAIPKIDGNQIDRIAIRFAGEVFLERTSPEDVALFNKLVLGHDVTLMVEAKCSATGAKGATDRDGDLDVTIGQRSVKVHTVYVPAGEYAI